jgi:tetratricopeptide (TPR) repeat protein
MASLMNKLHRYDDALAYTDKAIKEEPDSGLAYFIQGRIFEDMGKSDAAPAAYKKATEVYPDDFRFSYDTGVQLAKKGELKEAIQYFRLCLRVNPTWSDAYRDMGLAFQRLGRIEDALSNYRKAIEMNANDYITRYRAGYCFQELGYSRDAIYFYRQALKVKPDLLQALDKLAWILATSPDSDVRNPSEALRLAEKAGQMTAFNDYRILNTLAAAYASQTQFSTAVEVLHKAITLAQTNNDVESVRQFTLEMNLYQQNQAYLEPSAASPDTKNAP